MHRFPDWIFAVLSALVLLACAAFIVFVIHPGGFEGQIAWFFALMPGAPVGASFGDWVYKNVPRAERFAFWVCVIGVSLLWYLAVSYAAIKAYRFVVTVRGEK